MMKTFLETICKSYDKVIHHYPHSYHRIVHILNRIDFFLYNINRISKLFIFFDIVFYLFYAVLNGRMILTSKQDTNGLKWYIGHLTAEIHDDLAWEYEFFTSFLADEIKRCDAEMLFYYFSDRQWIHQNDRKRYP